LVSGNCLKNYLIVSPEEARAFLNQLEIDPNSLNPENSPVTAQMIEISKRDLTQLLHCYSTGKLQYQGPSRISQADSPSSIDSRQSVTSAKTETVYPSKKPKIPKELSKKAESIVGISKMDPHALTQEIPLGTINPSMKGVFFIDEEMRTPTHNGFIRDLGFAESYPQYQLKPFLPQPARKPTFTISYPTKTNKIPLPIKAELVSLGNSENLKVAQPNPDDPLVWRVPFQDSLSYTLQETNKENLLKANLSPSMYPTQAEQDYWKGLMPLPGDLEARIKESPKDLIHLITSFLAIKTNEGLSNFRYVCNQDFSNFLSKHKEDLPLIVNELKVGHCDLLSWYVAAQLRAHGRPAWVAGGRVTTKDGAHFNNAYKHSVVITVDDKGKLFQYDPTVHTDYDPAYHPDVMDLSQINKLDKEFSSAKTMAKKIKILREFASQTTPELRKKARLNTKVQSYLTDLAGNFLSGLKSENTSFSQGSHFVVGEKVNWSYPPRLEDITVDDLAGLIGAYDTTGGNWVPIDLTDLFAQNSLIKRQQSAFLISAYKKLGIPLDEFLISDPDLINSYLNHTISPPKRFFVEEWIRGISYDNFSTVLTSSMPLENLANGARYKDEDSIITDIFATDMVNIKLTRFGRDPYETNFTSHTYSTDFIDLLNKNIFITHWVYTNSLYDNINMEDLNLFNLDLRSHNISMKNFPVDKALKLRYELLVFLSEFQRSCLDKKYREGFLKKLNKDEAWFQSFSNKILGIETNKPRYINNLPGENNSIYPEKTIKDLQYPFKIDHLERGKLQQAYKTTIQALNKGQSRSITMTNEDSRPYTPGDDARKIDWNYLARSDQYYVRSVPVASTEMETPLHVVMDLDLLGQRTKIQNIQILELIRALQEESQKSKRKVYISMNQSSAYFLLPIKRTPLSIYKWGLGTKINEKRNFTYLSGRKPKMPGNILYVSDSYSKISAAKYLARNTNIGTIFLHEKPYIIHPTLDEEWVKNGYKEDYMAALCQSPRISNNLITCF